MKFWKKKKSKLVFFDAKTVEVLEKIKSDVGASTIHDVIRRAIALLLLASDGRKEGCKLFLVHFEDPKKDKEIQLD